VAARASAGVPGAPRGPLAVSDVLRNSMTLSWQPPAPAPTDGESSSPHYIVERRDVTTPADRLSGWSRVARTRAHVYSYVVPHLVDGHRYLYRVIAENEHGRGPPLETRHPVEAKSPFCTYLHQGGYIFYAGASLAGVSCRRRWPRLLLLC